MEINKQLKLKSPKSDKYQPSHYVGLRMTNLMLTKDAIHMIKRWNQALVETNQKINRSNIFNC